MGNVQARQPGGPIGPVGRGARVVVGGSLTLLAVAAPPGGLLWNLAPHEALLGLVVFPAVMLGGSLLLEWRSGRPVRLLGQASMLANCLLALVLFSVPWTNGAAALFFGTSMLLAGWRAQVGCEVTVISNALLRRDDQVGCCLFGPVDAWEASRG